MSTAHVVDLDENPSTGYRWEIVNIPSRLTVTSTFSLPTPRGDRPEKGAVLIGGGGARRFIFEGPPGVYAVKLVRRRPWDAADVVEEKTIEFTLDDNPQAAPGAIGAEMVE